MDYLAALKSGELAPVLSAWRRGGESRHRLLRALAPQAVRWAKLLATGDKEARRLAAALLGTWEGKPDEALELLHALSGDGDRRTRELAARAVGALLFRDFSGVYPVLGAWRGEEDPAVRRAVVVAAGVCARPERFDWAAPLLRLLEPLLPDRAPEVKDVLGPRVLAHELFTAYPDDVFEYLSQWSTSYNEQVLWHVALALSGPPAARRVRRSLIILRKLALDRRHYVLGAVTASLKRLGKLAPDSVLSELKRWLTDEDRAPVARAVLRSL
jgi:hypothetical protein